MTTTTAELIETGDRRDELGRRIVPRARRDELVRAYLASGLTQAAFARREGLRYTTLAHWVQVAQRAAAKAPAVQFAEMRLPAAMPSGLEVRLPDGTVLRGGSAAELAKLARALRA